MRNSLIGHKTMQIIFLKPIVSQAFFAIMTACAGVAELVDAPDSKSGGGDTVWVRLPPSVPALIQYFLTYVAWLLAAGKHKHHLPHILGCPYLDLK